MTDINTLKPYLHGAPREIIERVLTSDDSTDNRTVPISATYIARVATTEDITLSGAQTVDGVLIDVAPGATLFTQMQNLVLKMGGSNQGLYLPVNNGAWTLLSGSTTGRVTYVSSGTYARQAFKLATASPRSFVPFDYHKAFHGVFTPQPIASTNIPSFSGNSGHFTRFSDYRMDFWIRISTTFTAAVASELKIIMPFLNPIAATTDVIGTACAVTVDSEVHSFNLTGDSANNAVSIAFTKATNTTSRILQIQGAIQLAPPAS